MRLNGNGAASLNDDLKPTVRSERFRLIMAVTQAKMSAILLLMCYCSGVFFQSAMGQTLTIYNFQDLYQSQWAGANIRSLSNGQQVQLVMDQASGSGFQSKNLYTYGFFSVAMKLVPGNSAGTVTAFFLSSSGANHDEIDYEFLGNTSGQPYILQTNVFANGVGGREQRIYLPFDPTTDFHTYGIVWNHIQIMFLVDGNPIRVFKNLQGQGLAYPSVQPMGAYSALFDASMWATQGGKVPVDYAAAPFIATYGQFELDACLSSAAATTACGTAYQNNWWELGQYTTLTTAQINYIAYIRQSYIKYNYCTDIARNPTPPIECAANYDV